jgi:hypothetical protein
MWFVPFEGRRIRCHSTALRIFVVHADEADKVEPHHLAVASVSRCTASPLLPVNGTRVSSQARTVWTHGREAERPCPLCNRKRRHAPSPSRYGAITVPDTRRRSTPVELQEDVERTNGNVATYLRR